VSRSRSRSEATSAVSARPIAVERFTSPWSQPAGGHDRRRVLPGSIALMEKCAASTERRSHRSGCRARVRSSTVCMHSICPDARCPHRDSDGVVHRSGR
jgi:hypothetical protein